MIKKTMFKILLSIIFFLFLLFSIGCSQNQKMASKSSSTSTESKVIATFKDYDGSILSKVEVIKGSTPVYDKGIPTRECDGKYDYTFSNWKPNLGAISKDTIYTAVYTKEYHYYDATFLNYDDSILYSTKVRKDKTIYSSELSGINPQKPKDEEYYYSFIGWDKSFEPANSDVIYHAQYESIPLPYTLKFDLNGGKCDSEIKDKKTNELSREDFRFDLYKENKKFRGWMYNGKIIFDAEGNLVNSIRYLQKEMTFVALYENEYMVTVCYSFYSGGDTKYGDLPEEMGIISKSNVFEAHEDVSLFAYANQGYVFKGWYDGNHSTRLSNSEDYTFTLWEEDVIRIAHFEYQGYALSVTTNDSEFGDVQVKGGNASSSLSLNYSYKSNITLFARAKEGYKFEGWYNESGELVNENSVYDFDMPNHSVSLIAKFYKLPYVRNDNVISFGTYPQTLVDNIDLVSTLNTKAGNYPTNENRYNWNYYSYYVYNTNETYMYYQDIDDDGDGQYDYRGVFFSKSRNSYQNVNGYNRMITYWFKYEPIEWIILNENGFYGKALLLSNLLLDSQVFYPSKSNGQFTHNGGSGYANNYELSNIRKWLNDTFYKTAFNDLQKEFIKTTLVDNSSTTNNISEKYECNNTSDKIFLLSEKERYSYTFLGHGALGTDYAKCQGLYVYTEDYNFVSGYSSERFRTPCSEPPYGVSSYEFNTDYGVLATAVLGTDADCVFVSYAYSTYIGVRPAMWITL